MPDSPGGPRDPLASSGIDGLDDILGGGFPPRRLYLIEGNAGAGKTTLALQFLLRGIEAGERPLYITLAETKDELTAVARSHGWSLEGVEICEIIPSEDSLRPDAQLSMYHPSEVELGETTRAVLAEVDRIKPSRVVFDSLSELRLVASNPLRYRRQILALKQFFTGRDCTVLLLDDRTADDADRQVQSIVHGVVALDHLSPEYGAERRRLQVAKLRGSDFRGGYHDFTIRRGGLEVFPRLVAAESRGPSGRGMISSGLEELDRLLGGGLDQGTSTLLVGPPGTGKSTIASLFAAAAAGRDESAAIFIFDESEETLLERSDGFGFGLRPHHEAGRLTIQQVDPAELSPGEFAHRVRLAVERDGARVVVIDSLNGYLNAMPHERFLTVQLHEMLTYLGQRGVTTLLVVAQSGLIGSHMASPVETSYLADSIILLRFYEVDGEIRRAISVVKKRRGRHEHTIRPLTFAEGGVRVGEPLAGFRGVLTGVPTEIFRAGRADA